MIEILGILGFVIIMIPLVIWFLRNFMRINEYKNFIAHISNKKITFIFLICFVIAITLGVIGLIIAL